MLISRHISLSSLNGISFAIPVNEGRKSEKKKMPVHHLHFHYCKIISRSEVSHVQQTFIMRKKLQTLYSEHMRHTEGGSRKMKFYSSDPNIFIAFLSSFYVAKLDSINNSMMMKEISNVFRSSY